MTPLEFLYFLGLSINKSYCLRRQKRLPRKVVSIGNLTLGGTGKTPAAIALAREAGKRGLRPSILTRGYRGKSGAPCFVTEGEGALLDALMAGDEAVLMSEKLRGVPIVKGKNRYEAGMFALTRLPSALRPDLFILDDGFQHWGLWRDRDVLLVDGSRPFGNRRMLPLGQLREPIAAMSRADIIVITKIDSPAGERGAGLEGLIKEIERNNTKASLFFAGHRPSNYITVGRDTFPLDWAKGKRYFGFCGIGNHRSFRETLISAGVELTGFRAFRDHHKYSGADVKSLIAKMKKASADWLVTTEKDIMRLKGFELPQNLVALAIEFNADKRFYDEVFKGI